MRRFLKPLTTELKRASFRAQIITQQSGEENVSKRNLLAAVLVSSELEEICARIGCSAAGLTAMFDLGVPSKHLQDAEAALASQGIAFGSKEHLATVEKRGLRPPAPELLELIRRLNEDDSPRMTLLDVVEGLLNPPTRVEPSGP